MHLVGFTIEIYYDARPYESQKFRTRKISDFLASRLSTNNAHNSIYLTRRHKVRVKRDCIVTFVMGEGRTEKRSDCKGSRQV